MSPPETVLSDEVVGLVQREAARAHQKHGDHSLVNPLMPALLKLAALVEEVGEVGRALTYDEGSGNELDRELVQVASVALSWRESRRRGIVATLVAEELR